MGRIYTFLVGVVIGFGLYHAAIHYHVVYATDGLHLIAKRPPRFAEVYVDVRNFGLADWQKHPQLILAIEKAGKREILSDAVGNVVEEAIDDLLPPAQPER